MKRSILAHIRAIRFGHSERALVHALDARGLEYKLEVPVDEVRGVVGDMLVLSWTIHSNPAAVTTPTSVTTTSATAASSESPASPLGPAAVDEQFDVLMRGGAARSALTPEQQLAALLGTSGQKPG